MDERKARRQIWARASLIIFLVGLIVYGIGIFFPVELFWELTGQQKHTAFSLAAFYILPLMGTVGIITAIIGRRFLLIIPHIMLIFSFFITWSLMTRFIRV